MRLLMLGGTTEASALARSIAGRQDIDAMLSLAGRTRSPAQPAIRFRVGGFGGIPGLKAYLAEQKIDVVVDATHPFAVQMSRNAAAACDTLKLPLAVLTRPPWRPQPGDHWISVADMEAAVRALGERSRSVFLTVGGLQLAAFSTAPQHQYLIRTIEPPDVLVILPLHRLILARGPFTFDDEIALLRDEHIEALVSKNSGGTATEAKIAAARALGIEIIIVERPPPQDVPTFHSIDAVLAWIEDHRPAP